MKGERGLDRGGKRREGVRRRKIVNKARRVRQQVGRGSKVLLECRVQGWNCEMRLQRIGRIQVHRSLNWTDMKFRLESQYSTQLGDLTSSTA